MASRHIYRITGKEFTDKYSSLLRQYIWFNLYQIPQEKSFVAMDNGRRLTLTIRDCDGYKLLSLRQEDAELIYISVH